MIITENIWLCLYSLKRDIQYEKESVPQKSKHNNNKIFGSPETLILRTEIGSRKQNWFQELASIYIKLKSIREIQINFKKSMSKTIIE